MARVHCELHLCKTMEVAVADFWSVATIHIQIQGIRGRVGNIGNMRSKNFKK